MVASHWRTQRTERSFQGSLLPPTSLNLFLKPVQAGSTRSRAEARTSRPHLPEKCAYLARTEIEELSWQILHKQRKFREYETLAG